MFEKNAFPDDRGDTEFNWDCCCLVAGGGGMCASLPGGTPLTRGAL